MCNNNCSYWSKRDRACKSWFGCIEDAEHSKREELYWQEKEELLIEEMREKKYENLQNRELQ